MLRVGDRVTLKKGLVLDKLYGTVHFATRHAQYMGKLLIVQKLSSTGTAYCNYAGSRCEFGTLHESMVNIAKFRPGDTVSIWGLKLPTEGYTKAMSAYANMKAIVERVLLSEDNNFFYLLNIDGGMYNWPEKCLVNVDSLLEDLRPVLENENRLQEESPYFRRGERIQGNRVHGWSRKASIRSRPLRNPKGIRGK